MPEGSRRKGSHPTNNLKVDVLQIRAARDKSTNVRMTIVAETAATFKVDVLQIQSNDKAQCFEGLSSRELAPETLKVSVLQIWATRDLDHKQARAE